MSHKIALVTGGSRGLGRAIALQLAKDGMDVAVNYAGNAQAAHEVVALIEAMGQRAIAVQGDVSIEADVEKIIASTEDKLGKIEVLINNAGVERDGLLIRMKTEDWDKVLDINLKGVFLTTKLVGKRMLKLKRGRIVNITSVVGLMGNAGQANYAASKAGVIGFTKSVAKEFSSRGITVNAVAPGFIKSDMTAKLSDEVKDNYAKAIPLGRMGEAEDIANTVGFLVGPKAAYITGQTIQVDGGMYI